jgi:hypothetical protein
MSQGTPFQATNALMRVYAVINEAIVIGAVDSNKLCSSVWGGAFNLSKEDFEDFTICNKLVAKRLLSLDDEVCAVLEHIRFLNSLGLQEKIQKRLDHIRGGFSPALLSTPWERVKAKFFTPENMAAIEMAIHYFPCDEAEIDEEEIEKIKQLCDSLKISLEKSISLPSHVKALLLRKVGLIILSVEAIRQFGCDGLRTITNELIGILVVDDTVREAIKKEDPDILDVRDRLCEYIKRVPNFLNNVFNSIKNVEYAGEVIKKLLSFLG